ncbi:hypothetical protein QU487_21340 [Crenobacter sp. SG2305]|uniref:hypothetical protein n=1 Tax=Crenobacter oryzisoli TaxID=3056844 RepID=UPI0025AABC8F|nr:hypothetical protein [Crenobacter sp. SG2305]MDN0085250.1 hypothetical protein [Crenobacter sp. SG2305]
MNNILTVLVAADIGVTLVPQIVQAIVPLGVRSIDVTGEEAGWQVGLVWHPGHESPARDSFLRLHLLDYIVSPSM